MPVAVAAKIFGEREQVRQVSMSPDGTRFAAILSVNARAQVVAVAPVDHPEQLKPLLNASGDPERVRYCSWANDARIICSVATIQGRAKDLLGFTRQVVLNADGSGMTMLSGKTGERALGIQQNGGYVIDWYGDPEGKSILVTRQFVAQETTGTLLANSRSGMAVERVDPTTLKRVTVEAPNGAAEAFITDGIGNVRITARRGEDTSGYAKGEVSYLFRKAGSREWLPLTIVRDDAQTASGFRPVAVDPTLDVAYGFDTQDGRDALFRMALDGSGKRELVYASNEVDVDGIIQIGRKQRVVGVTFATDKRQTAFFDPGLQKLAAALAKAVPQLPLLSFVDSSVDESKLVLWGGGDTQPGMYLFYNKQTRQLGKLMDIRPAMADVALASVKSISYPAADGTTIPAYLTLPPGSDGKNLPAIVMPHGGPSSRDEWGFDWLAQFFAARGYAVIQPNYRGSSGLGEKWFVDNGFKSWRTAIGDIDDAGRWLIKQGITSADKLAIVGWSYGGYAALQSQVAEPDLFKAVVAIAPVTDLDALREESRNYSSFKLVDAFIGKGPHVEEGSPARHATAFKAPVLMFHGDLDQNVGVDESRLMAAKLKAADKPVDYHEYRGLDHQLDDSAVRAEMLAKIDGFLRTAMKLPAN